MQVMTHLMKTSGMKWGGGSPISFHFTNSSTFSEFLMRLIMGNCETNCDVRAMIDQTLKFTSKIKIIPFLKKEV